MRARADAFIVPPYNDRLLPHETFPPWTSLMHVAHLVAAALRRRAMAINLASLETALCRASQRIISVARGDLPLRRWHRRVRVAIHQLEQARFAIRDYVASETIEGFEAQAMLEAVDCAIEQLVEQVALVRIPDHMRVSLPELHVSPRLVR